VADATLAVDRRKGGLYARAQVPEYWIVNLTQGLLESHRRPVRLAGSRFGWRYDDVRHLGRDDLIAPLAAPAARIAVRDLVP